MRTRLVALGLVWGCFGLGVLGACGGDDSSSSPDTPDASTSSSTSSSSGSTTTDSGNPTGPTIVAADVTIYTGMTAVVDGSSSTTQGFTWVVKVVPPGSAVNTAALAGATTSRASFRADVSGDYVLTLTATKDGLTATKDVTVKAVPAPLFFMQSNLSENPAYFEYRTVGSDGTGGHPIACRSLGPPDAGPGDNDSFATLAAMFADLGEDWWEGPPGEPSRAAFSQFALSYDGGNNDSFLLLGTNLSTCQSPPAKIGPSPNDGGGNGTGIIQPRFSPNGARVAFIDAKGSDGTFLSTISFDGKDRRILAKLCDDETTCFKPAAFPPRPQWRDNQTVAWTRNDSDGGTGWEISVASDSANPNPHIYMTCDGVQPRSIAFLKDGSVIANRQGPDAGEVEDLWVLKPATAGGACTVVRNLTNLPTARSYARDFSISPEGNEVAFVRKQEAPDAAKTDGTRFGGQVYTVPVSGAAAPAPVTGTPQEAYFGPRYVAYGSLLAWNGSVGDAGFDASGLADGGGLPVMAVAPRDGGLAVIAAKSDVDAGTTLFGGGNGGSCDFHITLCSTGPLPRGGEGAALVAMVAGALLIRRRRNRR